MERAVVCPGIEVRVFGDGTPSGTRVETVDGQLVRGVTSVALKILANGRATAELTIALRQFDITARAVLSMETLLAAAEHHGVKVVPIDAESIQD
jgi:hypothetical protein